MAWQPDYVTLEDLRAYQSIELTVDDDQLALAITAASRAVDRRCGRQFGSLTTSVARTYRAVYDRHEAVWIASVDDIATTSGLVVTIDGTEVTGYTLTPCNASLGSRPWTAIEFGVDATVTPTATSVIGVTGTLGWSAVPTPVKLATLMQANRFAARRNSPYGVASSPAEGPDLRLMSTLDPDVSVILDGYVRKVWAA